MSANTGTTRRKCAWCGHEAAAEAQAVETERGVVNEYRCSGCGRLLAAYLGEAGDFLSKIRALPNESTAR
jgi:DNA-directed RNA polymerase subunit RPC12/RpoP